MVKSVKNKNYFIITSLTIDMGGGGIKTNRQTDRQTDRQNE